MQQLDVLGLNPVLILYTHEQAGHSVVTAELKKVRFKDGLYAQTFPGIKSVHSSKSGVRADMLVFNGDKLEVGRMSIEVRETPGNAQSFFFSVA